MAKRRRKGANLDALQKAATKAADVLKNIEEDTHRTGSPRRGRDPYYPVMLRPVKAKATVLTERAPRQLRLDHPQRMATMLALEKAAGRPVGRVTRKKLQGRIPEVVAETLCKRKRKRREAMFARGAAGKGKTKAARRQREHRFGRC